MTQARQSAMKDEKAVWSMEVAIADHLLAYKPLRIPYQEKGRHSNHIDANNGQNKGEIENCKQLLRYLAIKML